MKKLFLLFAFSFLVFGIVEAQTATNEIVRIPKSLPGAHIDPTVSIDEYRDFNTGKIENYMVFFRDNRYSHIYEVFSLSFKTKEEIIEWFEGLMEYFDKKYHNVQHTYKGNRISMTKNYVTVWEKDTAGGGYVNLQKSVVTKVIKQLKK